MYCVPVLGISHPQYHGEAAGKSHVWLSRCPLLFQAQLNSNHWKLNDTRDSYKCSRYSLKSSITSFNVKNNGKFLSDEY